MGWLGQSGFRCVSVAFFPSFLFTSKYFLHEFRFLCAAKRVAAVFVARSRGSGE